MEISTFFQVFVYLSVKCVLLCAWRISLSWKHDFLSHLALTRCQKRRVREHWNLQYRSPDWERVQNLWYFNFVFKFDLILLVRNNLTYRFPLISWFFVSLLLCIAYQGYDGASTFTFRLNKPNRIRQDFLLYYKWMNNLVVF